MKRFLVLLVILCVGFGCGQKKEEAASTQEQTAAAKDDSKESRPAIPDHKEALTGVPTLKPYFDENGTLTEKTVSPGETFDLYVIIGCGENDQITAAEYKLSLPKGITISREFDTDSLTMKSGKPEQDLWVAFKCSPGPKILLNRYACMVEDGFAGGSIATTEGEMSKFIGVVDCGPDPVQIPAEKGTAVLKIK
jgi:hypothetical protein